MMSCRWMAVQFGTREHPWLAGYVGTEGHPWTARSPSKYEG